MSSERRSTKRRKMDQIKSRRLIDLDSEVHNPLKMRMFLGAVFSFFVAVCIFAPLWFYILVVIWLMVDYFVMLGGTLNWLNRKIDHQFRGTGFFRRILATDARIIITTTSISVLILLADYFYIPEEICIPGVELHQKQFQWSDKPFSHSLHMVYSFYYYLNLDITDKVQRNLTFGLSELYIFIVLVRGLLIGSLIHVLHHLLINQHLAGVKFTTYPPIMSWVSRLVKWARK